MKYLLVMLLLCAGSSLFAQNTAPTVIVTSLGQPVANAGAIAVGANSTFNSLGLAYDISDAENDAVGVTAVVSNIAAAINWTEATFNKASTNTPYIHNVVSPLGEFGPANTVHVVTLTFTDGVDDTIFSFTIAVGATGPAPAGVPGDDGGACVSNGGSTGFAIMAVLLVALVYRRRRLT